MESVKCTLRYDSLADNNDQFPSSQKQYFTIFSTKPELLQVEFQQRFSDRVSNWDNFRVRSYYVRFICNHNYLRVLLAVANPIWAIRC